MRVRILFSICSLCMLSAELVNMWTIYNTLYSTCEHLTIVDSIETSIRMVAFKIYSVRKYATKISSKNLCHFSMCVFTFMPNIFHLLFHSLSIRWFCWRLHHTLYKYKLSWYLCLKSQNFFWTSSKVFVTEIQHLKIGNIHKPIDRAQNQFYSIQISWKMKKKLSFFPRKK